MPDIKGLVKEGISELAVEFWNNVSHFLVDFSYSLALVGGGIFIILYVAGFKKGYRYTGILVVSHVLIRYLLG